MSKSKEPDTFRIRHAREDDVHSLVRLENICFKTYYEEHRFEESEFVYYIRNVQAIIYVVTSELGLTGYVAGFVRNSRTRVLADLESIAVLPRKRGRGIGGRLLERFVREAKERGCARVMIMVAVLNKEGTRYFSKRGFRRIRRCPSYYGSGIDGVLMALDL